MDECQEAYKQWCKESHLFDTVFASWGTNQPSFAWLAWQAAWDYRNKHPIVITRALTGEVEIATQNSDSISKHKVIFDPMHPGSTWCKTCQSSKCVLG